MDIQFRCWEVTLLRTSVHHPKFEFLSALSLRHRFKTNGRHHVTRLECHQAFLARSSSSAVSVHHHVWRVLLHLKPRRHGRNYARPLAGLTARGMRRGVQTGRHAARTDSVCLGRGVAPGRMQCAVPVGSCAARTRRRACQSAAAATALFTTACPRLRRLRRLLRRRWWVQRVFMRAPRVLSCMGCLCTVSVAFALLWSECHDARATSAVAGPASVFACCTAQPCRLQHFLDDNTVCVHRHHLPTVASYLNARASRARPSRPRRRRRMSSWWETA